MVLEGEIGVNCCAVYNGVDAAKVGNGKGDYFSGRRDDVVVGGDGGEGLGSEFCG